MRTCIEIENVTFGRAPKERSSAFMSDSETHATPSIFQHEATRPKISAPRPCPPHDKSVLLSHTRQYSPYRLLACRWPVGPCTRVV